MPVSRLTGLQGANGLPGILTFIFYGIPYFSKLPGGMHGSLVAGHMPRLLADHTRFALEEAMPGPTDVARQNPGVKKATFNVPVHIEQNDMLITLRGDNAGHIRDVLSWLGGSNRLRGARLRSSALFDGRGRGHLEPGRNRSFPLVEFL